MSQLLGKAIAFAANAHKKQLRKYTNEPYIIHPLAVMNIVQEVNEDEEVLAAALLHDVIEDTGHSFLSIQSVFGDRVAKLVDELTDKSKPEDGNRKARKKIDRDNLAAASAEAQTIKLADMIHNSESILAYDKHFSKVFMREMGELVIVLGKGDSILWARAKEIVWNFKDYGSKTREERISAAITNVVGLSCPNTIADCWSGDGSFIENIKLLRQIKCFDETGFVALASGNPLCELEADLEAQSLRELTEGIRSYSYLLQGYYSNHEVRASTMAQLTEYTRLFMDVDKRIQHLESFTLNQ